jgi:hypothetical protein
MHVHDLGIASDQLTRDLPRDLPRHPSRACHETLAVLGGIYLIPRTWHIRGLWQIYESAQRFLFLSGFAFSLLCSGVIRQRRLDKNLL